MVFNGYFVRIFTVALLANLVSSVNCNAWHVLPSILRVHRASKVSAAMELLKSVWYFLTAENTGSQHAAWDEKSAFCHMSRVWVRWKASCFIFDLTNEQPLLICPAFLKHTGRYLFDLKVPKTAPQEHPWCTEAWGQETWQWSISLMQMKSMANRVDQRPLHIVATHQSLVV